MSMARYAVRVPITHHESEICMSSFGTITQTSALKKPVLFFPGLFKRPLYRGGRPKGEDVSLAGGEDLVGPEDGVPEEIA